MNFTHTVSHTPSAVHETRRNDWRRRRDVQSYGKMRLSYHKNRALCTRVYFKRAVQPKCGVQDWKMWSPILHFYFKKSVILSLNSSHSIQSSLIVLSDSEYCFCMKFGQLILRKIIKTVATRCQILRLKCTKIQLRLGLRPRPRWGSLQRSPRPTSWI